MTPGGLPLRDAFATPASKRRYVRRLFSTIADRYDLITVLLSFGLDRRWKRRVADHAAVAAGRRALDLACGTGDIALELVSRGASVVGLDITARMLELARLRGSDGGRVTALVQADMVALPFPDASFDVVTAGYGLRNVPELSAAVEEIARVLRPGGTFVSLDFDRPANPVVRAVYLAYLSVVGSALGWALHRDPDTYRYIPASIRRYPGARAVAQILRHAGFGDAHVVAVLGGLMAIHVARK
ncbi:MAG TPA: ubiquinone/menaquinone biosynthesis methyltransferase [Vicinamibacterales bacterium]|nr:ubiquinone/menaquinone biosynthesis methyltransferase [Vicinamibacterales bacterium]